MARIFGFVVGAVWLVFAGVAFRNSANGWTHDFTDLGFWWGVVGVFLTIASIAAFYGTWLHTRSDHHGVVEPVERVGQH